MRMNNYLYRLSFTKLYSLMHFAGWPVMGERHLEVVLNLGEITDRKRIEDQ